MSFKTSILLLLGLSYSSLISCAVTWGEDSNDHEEFPFCGSQVPNDLLIDLSEPSRPGPFHDLTKEEIQAIRRFLETDPNIKASKPEDIALNASVVQTADLYVASKSQVLRYLNGSAQIYFALLTNVVCLHATQLAALAIFRFYWEVEKAIGSDFWFRHRSQGRFLS
nr:amiloride-sensitive amine oxidase copper-containing-like [Biomphalaria glabrata]